MGAEAMSGVSWSMAIDPARIAIEVRIQARTVRSLAMENR